MKRLLCCFLLAAAAVARANQPPLERFLVPIYLADTVEGAFASRWASELRILNTGTNDAWVVNLGSMNPTGFFSTAPLRPGVEMAGLRLHNASSVENPGAILLVVSPFVDQLVFQARVRDTSRGAEGWGSWVPVVRESGVSFGPVHLLNVPLDDRYRQMLRVYDFDRRPGRAVRVRVFATRPDAQFPAEADPLLTEFVVPLEPIGAVYQPSYAQVANLARLPALAGYDRVRLSIQPEGNFKIWAMVSVTNNETQEVTMVVPNH